MVASALTVVDGGQAGSWIQDLLGDGTGPLVRQQVPADFDAYARIFHPASDQHGTEMTWAEVAERTGKVPHRLMQWHCIVGSPVAYSLAGALWSGSRPDLSQLELPKLDILCSLLARHTSRHDHCFFGLSTIHGGIEEIAEGKPLLRFPHRDFVIFSGPLKAAGQLALDLDEAGVISDSEPTPTYLASGYGQSPNLMWPSDQSWYVSTEFDFDSTLVGGSRALIDGLLDDRQLEVYVVDPDDSLAEDADKVNCVND